MDSANTTTETSYASAEATLHGRAPSQQSAEASTLPVDEKAGDDFEPLDWDGPDDSDNPKTWSPAKKWFTTFVVAFMCLVVTFGSSIFVSGSVLIALDFGVSRTVALLGLSLYLIGLAMGPTLAAPLSETVGRRPVYLISLPVSMLFTMGVGLSKNVGSILVLRFFSGMFASPVLAVAGGTIMDIWDFDMLGTAMSGFCLAPFAGPVLGPVIGGFLSEKKPWAWTMWVLLMFGGAILPFVVACPETYKPIILKKRAVKRGIALPPRPPPGQALKLIVSVTLVRPFAMLVLEPIVLALSVYMAFVFAVLFGFFEAFPFVFESVYHFGAGEVGLTFVGIGVGLLIGTAFYLFVERKFYRKQFLAGTPGEPETRLLPAKVGAVCLPVALFWLGWSSRASVHWIVPVLAGVPFGMGLILLFFTVITYLTMCFPPLTTASALAANNLARYVMAAGFPLFTIQMYEKMGIDWATSFYAFVSLALLPVPWVLSKYGKGLRMRSRYGYAALAKDANKDLEIE
ncbi:major facilitator superfamily domain-containing protein [Dipodascopsis tothii]|uniref:major facilitator superfamily domain-containing protein n=1 Tax=Dipodascopsis tothii TaxID=44089 RepID=UPI0034CD2731